MRRLYVKAMFNVTANTSRILVVLIGLLLVVLGKGAFAVRVR